MHHLSLGLVLEWLFQNPFRSMELKDQMLRLRCLDLAVAALMALLYSLPPVVGV